MTTNLPGVRIFIYFRIFSRNQLNTCVRWMTRFAEALAADGLKAMKRMSGKVNMETLSITGAELVDPPVDRKFKIRPEVHLFLV